jgi:hypothetical protein
LIGTKGKKVQKEVCIRFFVNLKEIELIILRLDPFVWLYFDVGRYHLYPKVKRIALDFYIQIRGHIFGFSESKEIEVGENHNNL